MTGSCPHCIVLPVPGVVVSQGMEPEAPGRRKQVLLGWPLPLMRGHPPTKSQAPEGQHPALCSLSPCASHDPTPPWLAQDCTQQRCPGSTLTRPKNDRCAAKESDPLSLVLGVHARAGIEVSDLEILAVMYTDIMITLCHHTQSVHSTVVFISGQ